MMGVWGDVISQLPPDLPDTSQVIVRLQRCNDRFYSSAWQVSVRNHQFADLGRAQARPTLKNIIHLREKFVILDPQVINY
jgi:hypothetical protein